MARPTIRHTRASLLAAAAALLCLPAGVAAANGGASFELPGVKAVNCVDGKPGACERGKIVRLSGSGLRRTRAIRFLGKPGRADDRIARPIRASDRRVLVAVPLSARSGRVSAVIPGRDLTGPELEVLPAEPDTPETVAGAGLDPVFPLRGSFDFGTRTNGFGGGRGHQGQDILSRCGTPIVAALPGTVRFSKFQSAAGNYVVVDAPDGTSHVYMHLRERSPLRKGDIVAPGDAIGFVGRTGRASACHLHFELWGAPGWYKGGRPFDPLPSLRAWARGKADVGAATRSRAS